MTVTADKQVQFGDLLLEGAYEIQSIEGLAGMPEIRTSDLVIAGRPGQRGGIDIVDSRTVTITIEIYAWDAPSFTSAVAALREVFHPLRTTTLPLTFKLPGIADGVTAQLNCRPRRLALPMVPTYWNDSATAVVELFAPDPVFYAETLNTQSTTLPSAGGGMTFDLTFDVVFGAISVGGSIYAVNEGSWPADSIIRIDGPVTNPRIENLTTGETLSLLIVIASGEFIELDTQQRTVLLGGTANRYSKLTDSSVWFQIQPGTNEITFRATDATDATMQLQWRSTWL